MGLGCLLGMLPAGIWEWKISSEEGALTWWVLSPPSALRRGGVVAQELLGHRHCGTGLVKPSPAQGWLSEVFCSQIGAL